MIYLRQSTMDNPFFKIHLKVMRYFGLAVFDDQRFHLMHNFRGHLAVFIWTTFIISQFVDLFQSLMNLVTFGDINKLAKNAPSSLLFLTALIHCYQYLYFKSNLMANLINEIDTNMNKIRSFAGDSEKHRRNITNILAKNVRYSNQLAVAIWFCSFMSSQMMCLVSIWNYFSLVGKKAEDRLNVNLLLLQSWYPVDVYENFIPIYIHQVINCNLGVVIVPLVFSLAITFKIYVSTMLQILNYRCETITDGIEDIESLDDRDLIVKEKLRDIVATHLSLGRFVQNLNELISLMMFFKFTVFSVLLCGLIFQSAIMEFGGEALLPISFVVQTSTALLMFYWNANEIIYHSSTLPNSIYLSDWCLCSKKLKKLILTFMIGSQRPLIVSALYFTMTLAVYIQILKAAYSYFTLLLQITDRG